MKVWVEVIGTDGVPQRREIATVDRSFRRIKPVGRIGNVTTAAGFTGFMAIDLVRSIRSLVFVACGCPRVPLLELRKKLGFKPQGKT